MTRDEATSLVAQINATPGWSAWLAKGTREGVPLVWFTRTDGDSRIYHATTEHDWYVVLNAWDKKEAASVHRD